MNERQAKRYLFDKPGNRKRVVRVLIALCLLLLALDGILHRHAVHPLEGLFGFYPLYGFVACVLLVLLAKELRKLVTRDQDYYARSTRASRDDVRKGGEDADA